MLRRLQKPEEPETFLSVFQASEKCLMSGRSTDEGKPERQYMKREFSEHTAPLLSICPVFHVSLQRFQRKGTCPSAHETCWSNYRNILETL